MGKGNKNEFMNRSQEFVSNRLFLLTGPDETHHILCCNSEAFGIKAIFHGRIRLHYVSSLAHSINVIDVAMLKFHGQFAAWFKDDHMTSILECSAELSSVQSDLKIGLIVNSFCFRIIFNPEKKIIKSIDLVFL